MKLYYKIKRDGIWGWLRADHPSGGIVLAQQICECRVCRPNFVRHSEDCGDHELGTPCCEAMAQSLGEEEE